jgi:ACS family D-galactonate transporter-like MFS transporter
MLAGDRRITAKNTGPLRTKSAAKAGGRSMREMSVSYRWNIMLLLASVQAIAYIDRVNLSVAGNQLVGDGVFTNRQLGDLLTCFNVAFTLSLLAAGPFTDWVRPRRSLPLGVSIWSASTALCAFVTSFLPLAVLRLGVGVGEATMIPSGSRVIRETLPRKYRTSAVGFFFAGNKIGLALGFPLAATLYAWWGWHSVFIVTGGLGFIWLIWWRATYRAPPPEAAMQEETTAGQENIRWATLLKYRTTWGLILGQGGYLYIYYMIALWLPGYLGQQLGFSIGASGFVGMLLFIVGFICVVLGGWASDALISRGGRITLIRKGFAVGGLFGATVFTVAAAFSDGALMAVVMLTLAVASFSFTTAAANSVPLDVAPPHIVSSLTSLQNFGGNLGGAFAPWVTSRLIIDGDFTLALLVGAAISLVFGCGAYGLLVGNLDKEYRESPPKGAASATA